MLQRNTVVLSLPQTLKHNLIMNWIVPMRRLLGTLLLALLLSNCSGLFESEAERQQRLAQHFEQGMRLFEQKEYTGAVESFRQVPPESALYNRSLAMIRRVPYQRGRDAYEEQRYADASRQFRAVPISASEYGDAQNYLREIEMIRIEQQYRESRGDRRRELLSWKRWCRISSSLLLNQPLGLKRSNWSPVSSSAYNNVFRSVFCRPETYHPACRYL